MQENRKKEELLSYANSYNSSIKALARVYALKKKGTFEEEQAYRNITRLGIISSEETMWMIQNTGPYIFKYRDIIKNRDWQKVMDMEFEEEQNYYKSTNDGSNPKHTKKAMKGKIDFIKKIFVDAKEEEQEAMLDYLQELLSSYCKFALHVKKYGI